MKHVTEKKEKVTETARLDAGAAAARQLRMGAIRRLWKSPTATQTKFRVDRITGLKTRRQDLPRHCGRPRDSSGKSPGNCALQFRRAERQN